MHTRRLAVPVVVAAVLTACAPADTTRSMRDVRAGDAADVALQVPDDVPVVVPDAAADAPADDAAVTVEGDVATVPDDAAPVLVEDCDTPWDDDDDGEANEGCTCMPGLEQPCFERPEDRFGGMCRMGRQRCEGGGEFGTWSACAGSWLPLAAHMEQCEVHEPFAEETAVRPPVDILWFVDTSGSMTEETAAVNANLNTFASVMASSGIDFHVVMVARRGTGTLRVCVPAPLGSPNCGDTVRFRHVNTTVGSNNGLQVLINAYPQFSDFLRPAATKFFVAVTDDESHLSADAFQSTVNAWPGFTGFVFHSIVGYENTTDCPSLAARGGVYLTLTERTHGEKARVCSSDWSGIFTTFARSIVSRSNTWVLAESARADTVQVWRVTAGGTRTQLTTGWRYDAATHTVTVDVAALPAGGDHLEVVYRPASASP